MDGGRSKTRAEKDDPKQDTKKQDAKNDSKKVAPEKRDDVDKTKGDVVSNNKADDTKVENTVTKLKEEVKKMKWEKSNFDEFNALSVTKITGN